MHLSQKFTYSCFGPRGLLAFALLFSQFARSESPLESVEPRSVPSIETYPLQTIPIDDTVKAIRKLPKGEIAFLTYSQLFTFDGTQWGSIAEIERPTELAIDNSDQALAGNAGGIVRMVPNTLGEYDFERLTSPEDSPDPQPDLLSIASARGHTFGSHGTSLTVVAPDGSVTIYQLENWASSIFAIGDDIYTTGGTQTLLNRWDWKAKRLVDCQSVLNDTEYLWFTTTKPRQQGGGWLLNESNRIVGFDGSESWFWKGNQEIAKRKTTILDYLEIAPGQIAIATNTEGVLIFDTEGNVSQQVSKRQGLDDDSVQALGADDRNGLWIATEQSVTRLLLSPNSLTFSEPNDFRPPQTVQPIPLLDPMEMWGVPRIESYAPQTTRISDEVTAIHTLPRGEIAFFTESTLFTFDGIQWDTLPELERPIQLSQTNGDQTIASYVGGMVRMTSNTFGNYDFEHLTGPENFPDSPLTLHSIASARGYIFGSHGTYLTIVAPDGSVEVHPLEVWASSIFAIEDQIYTTGGTPALLNRWDWKTKQLVDCQGVLNATEYTWLTKAKSRQRGGAWLLNESNRIVGYDGSKSWFWKGNQVIADRKTTILDYLEIAPDQIAVATSSEGLLVFDVDGNVYQQTSKAQGLDDVSVHAIGKDNQDGLWISTKRSISRIQLHPNTLIFDERHGINESVNAIEIFNGHLYLATNSGLYVNNPDARSMQECFVLKHQISGIADLLAYRGSLFVAAANFLVIDENGIEIQLSPDGATNLWQPSRNPDLILAGNYRGVMASHYENGRWNQTQSFQGPDREVFNLTESEEGTLLAGLGGQDYAKVILEGNSGHFEIRPIPQSTQGKWSVLAAVNGTIHTNTAPSMKWDEDTDDFIHSPNVHYFPGAPPYGFSQIFGTSSEDAWVCVNDRRGQTVRRPNREVIGRISSMNDTLETRAHCIVYDENNRAWIGGSFGLMLAPQPHARPQRLKVVPNIHRLISMKDGATLPIETDSNGVLRLSPQQNSLRIEAEFTQYFAANQNQLQIYIEGFDSTWPEFTSIPLREVTNLPPGRYVIVINARNTFGQTSLFGLPILVEKPWYLHPISYGLYFATLVLIIVAVVYLYNRQQILKSKRLEKLINERTQEIENKNAALEQQAIRLESQNEELEEKTEELTSTTQALTATLNDLHEMQDKLVETARTAGKAEIAINVLHNVGNVLNSLNVSINVLNEKVENSNVPRLGRISDLIRSHEDKIGDFMDKDPKGKNIPNYLVKLSTALDHEINSIHSELSIMSDDIDHVKSIIAAQQTHAKSSEIIEAINLREICETALNVVCGNRSDTNIEVLNEIPEDLTVTNDKHRLLDIVLNLVSNAVDAIEEQRPEVGLITFKTQLKKDTNEVEFLLLDNGSGIDADTIEKLFKHGFTTKVDGHGFGLHSCAISAKNLGGNLSLESEGHGKGALARLTLPKSFA